MNIDRELNETLSKHLMGKHDQGDHHRKSTSPNHRRRDHGTEGEFRVRNVAGTAAGGLLTVGGGLKVVQGAVDDLPVAVTRPSKSKAFDEVYGTNRNSAKGRARAAGRGVKRGLLGTGVALVGREMTRQHATKQGRKETNRVMRSVWDQNDRAKKARKAKKKVEKSWDSMVVSKGE